MNSPVAESGELEQELGTVRADLEAAESKKTSQVKALEKSGKQLRQEKEDLHRVRAHCHLLYKVFIFRNDYIAFQDK